VSDPVLVSRRSHEATHLRELAAHAEHIVLEPWAPPTLRRSPAQAAIPL
jgi:hypothetical protein